ncbi:hypothetical protein BGZ93_007478 [Podila epicladia]|nr:hypothetical protein BGZ92_010839 [Podila epicladia]KAG0099481.1 hypothetical protein BGZ93_007478 [Podila epicladia]
MASTPSTSSPMSTPNLSQGAIFSNSTAASSAEPLQTPGNNISSNMGASLSSTTVTHTGSASSSTTMTSTTSPIPTGGMGSGVSDAKLKRFLEHNQRLREQLEMRRISVSEAGQCLIKYVTNTKDSLLPMIWGNPASDPFSKQTKACCTIS